MTYSEKLKHPKWQKKRLEILSRDKFTCKLCRDKETMLHVHHKEYWKNTEPWDYPNTNFITLCRHCHEEVEECKIRNNGELNINDIKIYKSNNWTDKSIIMFIAIKGSCEIIMRVYDNQNNLIVGFSLDDMDIHPLPKLLKHANG